MNILMNKNCFVTGATGGLGKQISYFLAKKNCNLFLTSTDEKNLKKLTEDLEIQWNWVKGHSSDPFNELADTLAKRATPV